MTRYRVRGMVVVAGAIPARTDQFVGRERELRLVTDALRTGRLVTLTGPGGVGKTRLALEFARRGARRAATLGLVDLSTLSDGDLVANTFASALGIAGAGEDAIAGVGRAIGERTGLLVVDNCEHVIEAAASAVHSLLLACPRLRVLATSRAPLRIAGETVRRLEPLEVPDAVRLFSERARAARADAVGDERSVLEEICSRLDGMPLALELAAARLAVLSPEMVLARLGEHLELLRRETRSGPARHHSLTATIRWSYQLLSPEEQAGFAQLAVFPGSFAIEAAGEIAGVGLDMLEGLVSKSLVAIGGGAERRVRYRLLETLRAFALEQLRAGEKEEELRRRHLDFYLSQTIAVFRSDALGGSEDEVQALAEELPNLRAALGYARDRDPAAGLTLLGAAREVFFRSSQGEGLVWVEQLLTLHPRADTARAMGLLAAGHLGVAHQDHGRAGSWLQECIELAQQLGNEELLASACHYRGVSAMLSRNSELAERCLMRSTELFRKLNRPQGVGRGLGIRGVVRFLERDWQGARELLDDALDTLADCDDPWGNGQALTYRGLAARETGDQTAATRDLRQAASVLVPTGDATILGIALAGLATILVETDPRTAARLAGASVGTRQRIGGNYPPWTLEDQQTTHDTATRRLGQRAAHVEWEAGLGLDTAEITGLLAGREPSRKPGPLSPRELQVAGHVASGLTNAQIAQQLTLSERTVENHIFNALRKLGLRNRTQLATWITQHPPS